VGVGAVVSVGINVGVGVAVGAGELQANAIGMTMMNNTINLIVGLISIPFATGEGTKQ
jgi:hypothetical protein